MKKLFFAVIAAAFVFVSANNVFASNKMISTSAYEPTDTVAPADTTETTTEKPAEASLVMSLSDIEPTDTVAPAETPAPTETPAPADTTNTPADSTAEQAQ
ncbi:hypothetical protein F7D20_01455 [Prevotella copri]|jgi:hypothetical protein|uniref:Uncharacterized protein n=1 Tax=Segatella copri TaxID=165179 RepID=A0A6A7W891_9BACT|nr:hypothetical protein [Segatella copri]MQP10655.1 hypothetical protein [Segatella copri]